MGAGVLMLSISKIIFSGLTGQPQHNCEMQPKEIKNNSCFSLEDLSQSAALDESVQVRAQV